MANVDIILRGRDQSGAAFASGSRGLDSLSKSASAAGATMRRAVGSIGISALVGKIKEWGAATVAIANDTERLNRLSDESAAKVKKLAQTYGEMGRNQDEIAVKAASFFAPAFDKINKVLGRADKEYVAYIRNQEKVQRVSAAFVATFERQLATVGMTTQQIKLYNAAQAGVSKTSIKIAERLQEQIDKRQKAIALEKEQAEATAALTKRTDDYVASLRQEAETFGMTARQRARHELAAAGADPAALARASEADKLLSQLEAREEAGKRLAALRDDRRGRQERAETAFAGPQAIATVESRLMTRLPGQSVEAQARLSHEKEIAKKHDTEIKIAQDQLKALTQVVKLLAQNQGLNVSVVESF